MSGEAPPKPDRRGALGIVVVALLAHGLWLFNDGVFHDAWLDWAAGTYGKWDMMQRWFTDSGMPQVGWIHRVMMRSPAPQLSYALLSLGCFTATGLVVRTTARRLGASDVDAAVAGMLVVASRVACVGLSFIHAPYFMSLLALFVAGDRLVVDAQTPFSGRALLAHRLALYALLFVMSMMPSTFATFYVFLLAAICLDLIRQKHPMALVKRLDLIALPVVLFLVQRRLFPAQSGYEGNNTIRPGRRLWVYAYRTIDGVFTDGAREALQAPVVVLVVGAVVVALLVLRGRKTADVRRFALGVLFSFGWMVAALVPYAVVGKGASAERIFTWRHGMLVFFVPAFVYVAVAFVARGAVVARVVWAAVAGVFVAGQAFTAARLHAEWLSRAVEQRAIVSQARAAPLTPMPEVVWVKDTVPDPRSTLTISYELTGMVSAALGALHAGALPASQKDNVDSYKIGYFRYFLLPDFRGDGPHATLTVAPRAGFRSDNLWSVGLGYAAARVRFAGADYANDLVDVSLTPTDPPANWSTKLKEVEEAQRLEAEKKRKQERRERRRLRREQAAAAAAAH